MEIKKVSLSLGLLLHVYGPGKPPAATPSALEAEGLSTHKGGGESDRSSVKRDEGSDRSRCD